MSGKQQQIQQPRRMAPYWGMKRGISPTSSSRNCTKFTHTGQKQLFCAVYCYSEHLLPVRTASLPNSGLLLDAQASPMPPPAPCCLSPARSFPMHLGWAHRSSVTQKPSAGHPKTFCRSLQGTDSHCTQPPWETATLKGRKGKKPGTSRLLQDTMTWIF